MKAFSTYMEEYGLLLTPDSAAGFTLGFFVGAVFILLVVILLVLHRHTKVQRDCVTVDSENGTLYITSNAVREFVERILGQYQAASLHGITLRQRSERLILRIDMDVLPDTQVVPMVDDIRAAIIGQASEKLGITMPIRVDVSLRSLSAKEGKIVRQHRRSAVPVKRSKPAGGADDESAAETADMQEQSLDMSGDEEEREEARAWEAAAMEAEAEGVLGDEFAQPIEPPIIPSEDERREQSQAAEDAEGEEQGEDKEQGKGDSSDKKNE